MITVACVMVVAHTFALNFLKLKKKKAQERKQPEAIQIIQIILLLFIGTLPDR